MSKTGMRVLLTGAGGRIGSAILEASRDRYRFRLTDLVGTRIDVGEHEVRYGDLTDPDFVAGLAADMDAIVHLAGTAVPDASFDDVMALNIVPTKLLLDAAVAHGVTRFVFASSAQTIEGFPHDRQATPTDIWPANFYGAGKVMGEALCALYAGSHGLETVSLRIGAFEPLDQPANLQTTRDLSAWLSPRDAVHLVHRSRDADVSRPLVVSGISNNRFKRLSLESADRDLDYRPVDDAFAEFQIPIDRLT